MCSRAQKLSFPSALKDGYAAGASISLFPRAIFGHKITKNSSINCTVRMVCDNTA